MSIYDETKHDRGGNPENAGQFNKMSKSASEPEVSAALVRPHPTNAQAFDLMGQAFRDAFEMIPIDWVLTTTDKKALVDGFKAAATDLDACVESNGLTLADIPYEDKVLAGKIKVIARGADPRGGTIHDQAVSVAAALARHLITRGGTGSRPVAARANTDLVAGDVIIGFQGRRMPIRDVQPEGEYMRLATPFGSMLVDVKGSQAVDGAVPGR